MTPQTVGLWPLVLFCCFVFALVGVMIGLSHILGQRTVHARAPEPFESGIKSAGGAHLKMPAQFYLMAMFFVVFDLEAAFLFAWASAVEETGWTGFAEVTIFVTVLVFGLIYLWRDGALDWAPKKPKVGKIILNLHG